MGSDLISRSALSEKLEALMYKYAAQGRKEVADDYNFVLTVLMTADRVDAVEVVRCKDCARRKASADLTNTVFCPWLHGLIMPKDGFCSYGERRTENAAD